MPALFLCESPRAALPLATPRAAAGCWTLAQGRALSLRPQVPSVLVMAQGRVWLTLGGQHAADHVLQAGERMTVPAGAHVVLEAWVPAPLRGEVLATLPAVAFRWDPAEAMVEAGAVRPTASDAMVDAAAWESRILQPLRDLGRALALGGKALAELAVGVGRYVLPRRAPVREC